MRTPQVHAFMIGRFIEKLQFSILFPAPRTFDSNIAAPAFHLGQVLAGPIEHSCLSTEGLQLSQ